MPRVRFPVTSEHRSLGSQHGNYILETRLSTYNVQPAAAMLLVTTMCPLNPRQVDLCATSLSIILGRATSVTTSECTE
ncbi:hypothetical protein FQN60_002830 [Etheostoma spectabile]|uniref:Uncharacterized protein n=1 Tax=Etheostoma spectabile TaxID=54343 RepID=A0A5J5CKP3_9PERO|nr:hypothetical protein FQN60_002830 [Etheostoma spectabile]